MGRMANAVLELLLCILWLLPSQRRIGVGAVATAKPTLH